MPIATVYRSRRDGIDLFVRLTPKSSRDAVDGPGMTADGQAHLSVRVRALPEKGAANAALERLLADWLEMPRKAVRVVGGAASRLKTVRLAGEPATLAKSLDERMATGRN